MQTRSVALLCVAMTLTCACKDRKQSAAEAIDKARDTLAVLRMDSAPHEFALLEDLHKSLNDIERRNASGDYKGVLADAPGVMKELESAGKVIQELRRDAEDATAQAVERWNQISGRTGQLLVLVDTRIEQRARTPGTTADLETLATARAALADLRSQWLQAGSMFASGEVLEAVKLAEEVDRRARKVLHLLGA